MKRDEARKQGFCFTGMYASMWDTDKLEKQKQEAQEIRRNYKGADFRIVTEDEGKSIYGNDVFWDVRHFNQENAENYLNNGHQRILDQLAKEYERNVNEEQQRYEKEKARYDYIMSLKKN